MGVHGVSASSTGELRQHDLGASDSHHEVGATAAQPLAELRDGVDEESSAIGTSAVEARGGTAEVTGVKEEDGKEGEGLGVGGGDGLVVVEAQISAEPDDGAAAGGSGGGRVCGAAAEEGRGGKQEGIGDVGRGGELGRGFRRGREEGEREGGDLRGDVEF